MVFAVVGGVLASVAVAVVVARTFYARHARARIAAHAAPAIGAHGIVTGAEPLHLVGTSDRGVLLLHGFNDTPQSVAQLARALHERGWSVTVPLLPHHGRGSDHLSQHGNAEAWIAAARDEWQALCARTPRAVLAGQSMGGAIAVVLAAERAPSALVLLAPYLNMGRLTRLLASVWPLWQLFTPRLVSDSTRGLYDPTARTRARGNPWFTPRLVAALNHVVQRARRALPAVHAPTLVLHARLDYRIPSRSALHAYERIRATDKTLIWRERTGHVMAADTGREEVSALVGDWLEVRVAEP